MNMRSATFVISAAITILIIGSIVIGHEVSTSFKQVLTNLTGHHWISESAIAIILFALISILLFESVKISEILHAHDLESWSYALIPISLMMTFGVLIVCGYNYFGH